MNLRAARAALATGLAGAALVLCALAVGSSPLLVPGLGLLVLSILAPAAVLWSARGVRVSQSFDRTRVQEDEALEVVVRIAHRRWDPAQVELVDSLLPGGRAPIRSAAGELRTEVRLASRGRHRLPAPALTVADPLGLIRCHGPAPAMAEEILVLPRIEPVHWLGSGPRGDAAGARAGRSSAADPIGAGDLDGLRPYRHGAPASRIHWSALARGAGLMERRLRPDGDGWPLVLLDGRGAASRAELDTVVRAAASIVLELAQRGGARLVLPGQRRALPVAADLGAWASVHARLALLEDDAADRAPVLAGASTAGLVVYVAARVPPRLPSLRGVARAVLVLPDSAPGGSGRPVLTTGGCHGYELRAQLAGAA